MRLSSVCLAALRITLALAVILFFPSNILAQHSAGGGGSSGGSFKRRRWFPQRFLGRIGFDWKFRQLQFQRVVFA